MPQHPTPNTQRSVKKAVIPAAGFGTRLLPATKAQPKEMLPIVDKPVIQYVVEEAVHSGITDILIIIADGKEVLKEHFRHDIELESLLKNKGKKNELASIHELNHLGNIHFEYQHEQKGLGDAILCAETFAGDEPFAVLLGDTITFNHRKPLIMRLAEIFSKHQSPVLALEKVSLALAHRYGIFAGKKISQRLFEAEVLIEKPRGKVPTGMAMAGRYILTPDIFDCLKKVKPGVNHEIQLTDAMRLLMNQRKILGYLFDGKRYDVGNRLDFIKTNLEFGLKNKEIGVELKKWLKNVI